MTEDRFLDCLDHWGSDLTRWPAADRMAAQTLLARSDGARTLLARERVLEQLLSAADPADTLDTTSLTRVKARVFAAIEADGAALSPSFSGGKMRRKPPSLAHRLTERLRGWFDLPGPVIPWGVRLASVLLIAAIMGSLAARLAPARLGAAPSATALEQIAMLSSYSPLDVQ